MIKYFIIIVNILFSNYILIASDDLLISKVNELDVILLESEIKQNAFFYKQLNNNIYIMSEHLDSNSNFNLIEINQNKVESKFSVQIPPNLTRRIYLKDFEIYNELLYLNLQYEIAVFNLVENNTYVLKSSIKKDIILDKIKIINKKIYGVNSKYYANSDINDSLNTYLWIYDLVSQETKIKSFEDPKGIEWTQIQPRKLIDISSNKLVISDANNYSFRIFNLEDQKLLYTINNANEFKNYYLDLTQFNKYDKNKSKKILEITYGLLDFKDSCDIIVGVNLLSDNKILITKSISDSSYYAKIYYDVWEFENDGWNRSSKNLVSGKSQQTKKFSFENMFIENLLISENYFICLQSISFKIEEKHFLLTFEEFYKSSENLVKTNYKKYSFLVGYFDK